MMQRMYCLSRRPAPFMAGYLVVGIDGSARVARLTGCVAGNFDNKRG
jgi:hypothetical protein